jgi:hypothetical protein
MNGRKNDKEKLQWHLLPMRSIEEEIKVLMFGAKKYSPNNWMKVDNAIERYTDAIFRHTSAITKGEYIDKETGLPHSAHISCCADFLTYFLLKEKK